MNKHALSSSPACTGDCLCAQCAAAGTCCCHTDPALGHLCFPLSEKEWERLVPYAHLARVSDVEAAAITPPGDHIRAQETTVQAFTDSLKGIFPGDEEVIDQTFPLGNTHFRLRTNGRGECVFLTDQGCALPRDVRPWYCLLFPAWINRNSRTMLAAERCLIVRKAQSIKHGYELLGVRTEDVRFLYNNLRKDWGFPPL